MASVAPNIGGSDNFVAIKNNSGGNWYFYSNPTPSAARMSRTDSSGISEYAWPTDTANFTTDAAQSRNRIYSGEFLRVYDKTLAVGTTIQVEFAYSPSGTRYHFNVLVTSGAQVTSLNIIDANPTAAASVRWRVTFDQAVSGVTAANFAFNNPALITGLNITSVTADTAQPSTSWTITAATGTGNGILGLNWTGHQSESPTVPNTFTGQSYDFTVLPIISQDPFSVGLNRNTTTNLVVVASLRGGGTLNYQWYSGTSVNPGAATTIPGATSSTYTPPSFGSLGTYQYFCRAYTIPATYRDSVTAVITVVDPPSILTQPVSVITSTNQQATFGVSASGSSLQVQWYQGIAPDATTPVGSGSATLVTSPLATTTKFWARIYNAGPTVVNSSTATATVVASLTPATGNYKNVVGGLFPSAFAVTARDSASAVVANVPVIFAAPGSGASGTFSGGATVNTGAGGVATAPSFTANSVAGIYTVTAKFVGLTANFNCTNMPTFNAAALAGITNTDTTAAYNLATVSGAQSAGGTFSGAGVSGSTFTPASAGRGPHVITYTVNGLQASFNLTVIETPSLVVTTTADVVDPYDGVISLREALTYAASLSGPQTITFASALTTSGPATVSLTQIGDNTFGPSALVVNTIATIQGPTGANGITLLATNGGNLRHFVVNNSASLTLANLKLSGGVSLSFGGGSIESSGTLNILNSTFANNTTPHEGGAIWTPNLSGVLTITNSTFAYNSSGFYGGAIANACATTKLNHVTMTDNDAGSPGGALLQYGNPALLVNTLIARNTSATSASDIVLVSGATVNPSSQNNLIGIGGAGGMVNGTSGNIVGQPLINLQVSALANNGGPTPTVSLLPGSPAINAGVTTTGVTTDQRGLPLVAAPDIGAFEYQGVPPVFTTAGAYVFLTGISNIFYINASGAPAPGFTVSGTLPAGVSFDSTGILIGAPPIGSAGVYPLTLTATNGFAPNATQNFTLTVLEKNALASHPTLGTNGAAWTLIGDAINGGPNITNNTFTPTDGFGGESRGAWLRFPLYVGGFQASFTYQDFGGGGADGVGFVIQNDPRGTSALGIGGGGLGYADITPSVAVLLNIYSGSPGGAGMMLGTNGIGIYNLIGAPSGRSFQATTPVNPAGGNPINVQLRYLAGNLSVTLKDLVTSSNYQTSFSIDIPSFVGSNSAWVGFVGSEGGVLSHQTVSNFTYVPLPALSANGGNGFTLSWPATAYGYSLQSNTNLAGTNWVSVVATVNETNGLSQAIVPTTAKSLFYRLVLP